MLADVAGPNLPLSLLYRTHSRFMSRLFVVADYECARDVIEDITDAGLKITQPQHINTRRPAQCAEKAKCSSINSRRRINWPREMRNENQPPRAAVKRCRERGNTRKQISSA